MYVHFLYMQGGVDPGSFFFPFWPGSKYTCAFLRKQYNNNIICHFFKYHTHLTLLISSMCTIYLWLCTPAGCTDSTLIVHASLVYVYQMRFDLSKKKKNFMPLEKTKCIQDKLFLVINQLSKNCGYKCYDLHLNIFKCIFAKR